MNKREIIAQAIEAGGATKESLMITAEVNAAGLASQFTYLRLTGKYPVKQEDGSFKFVTAEIWEEMKASAATGRVAGPTKTPAEQLIALEKREAKQVAALDKRQEAYNADKSKLNKLKLQRANVELDITLYELDVVKGKLEATPATEEAAVNE
jgi:hypothetical protein